ncbi:bifunctional copper resistance protein CopD/cytochrome c oxidase assembly protein [Microbacterium hominis]|uniref:Bifunctional copper resistance protein CopD/cytochrome c oxidase assembly protein n=2 Tax=Microbacterium hominis TaxID=162426 RepID=A0A7D4PXZ3_9MICO|nr:bifunctional copper resistance protein CopD/cytochrome c oxidase assembly protein [Microbacterium hominis]
MVGVLVTALFTLRSGEREFDIALDAASISAAVFTVAAAATGFFTFIDAFNPAIDAGPEFGAQLARFLVDTEVGRTWLITTVAGAVLTVLTFAVRGWTTTLFVAILAVAALIPMGTQGHSGYDAGHDAAVVAIILHIIAAAVWVGGLLLLVLVRPVLAQPALATVVTRYSSIALVAFIVVAVSGTVRAAIGLGDWSALLSEYGVILMVKIAALGGLGLFGAWYRRRLIGGLTGEKASRSFWTLIAFEFALMGVASGAAAALARTPPPVDTSLPAERTPAQFLTDAPLPPELTPLHYLTAWDIDLLWAFAVGFGLLFYLAGVWRLRRRGDAWPVYRTVLWSLGLLLLLWVTGGVVNVYQDYLFSIHMVGHMLLTMAIPVMLVAGAPVTLAMRAIRKRDDGTRGGREWILWAVHSPVSRVLTNPFVAAGLFVGSLWVFYYTDLFRWSLYDHLGHEWMIAHFLITGYLFVLTLIGIDPVPYRLPYPGRLLLLIGVMAMHAFFGIAIMMQEGLMVAEWFGSMGRTWGATPLEDQYIGGGVAWSIGEIPTLVLAITVAIQWSRSDARDQKRQDRHADRTGDAELEAYNEHLAKLAERDARTRT